MKLRPRKRAATLAAISTLILGGLTAAPATAGGPDGAGAAPAGMHCPGGGTPIPETRAYVAPVVPAGFDPVAATPERLQAYGFPPRPTAGQDGGWLTAMKAWRRVAPPEPGHSWSCPIKHAPGPVSQSIYNIWGGNEFDWYTFGGGTNISAATINFVLTPLTPDYNHCDDSVVSPWTGLGGDDSTAGGTLVQAGIDMGSGSCGGHNSYNSWWEVVDGGPQQQTAHYDTPSLGMTLGDDMYVEVSYSGYMAYFFMEDLTRGTSWTESDSFVGTTGTSAEWVVEKEFGTPLARWGAWNLTDCYGHVTNSGGTTWVSAGAPAHDSMHLVNPSRTELAHGGAWNDSAYSSFPIIRVGNQSQ